MTISQNLNIVHLDRATIGPSVSLTMPETPHRWTSYDSTSETEVIERLQDADVVVLNKVSLSRHHLEALPGLKMIAISATGFDKIDIQACQDHGVIVSNITDYAQQTVPEHTFALILSLRRSITAYCKDVQAGAWQASGQFCFFNHPISDLHGSTLGIIGTGSIGNKVIAIAEAFGMHVLRAGRKGEDHPPAGYTKFEDVITNADIISLHCPLTPETKDLIAKPEFEQMTKTPLIINASRGGLVNEADVIDALDKGLIGGAAFDVLTTEPPAEDHLFMAHLSRPNLIVTPHIAWASSQAMQILWDQLIGHIDHFARGTPRNMLKPAQ